MLTTKWCLIGYIYISIQLSGAEISAVAPDAAVIGSESLNVSLSDSTSGLLAPLIALGKCWNGSAQADTNEFDQY